MNIENQGLRAGLALVAALVLWGASESAWACGGENQRACCVGEGPTCQSGLVAVAGCSGNCKCGNSIFGAAHTCRRPICGGKNQRGCCIGAERAARGFPGPCEPGLIEDLVNGCSGSCGCLDSIFSSAGTCRKPGPCGGNGQRACCVGVLEYAPGGGSCGAGLVERPGCSGDCFCGGATATGQSASGTCVVPQCGGEGQRGCCVGAERAARGHAGPCQPGLIEDVAGGCQGNCGCTDSIFSSSGICRRPTPCGGEGQRACCVGVLELASGGGSCGPGLVEKSGCVGDCTCGGATATGQDSLGTCVRPQCGAEGQRGCCVGAERAARGFGGPCEPGLIEDLGDGCQGDCQCTDSLFSSAGTCRRPPPCGGVGQRACCTGLLEYASGGLSCNGGLVEISGCPGDCTCGGATATGQDALGLCVQPAPCGGLGQRACCVGTLEFAPGGGSCAAGLVEFGGCSGDCQCGGPTATGGVLSSGTCSRQENIPEPSTHWTPPASAPRCPLRGVADIHLHMFANTGHGGAAIHGEVYSPSGGINDALRQCHGTDEDYVNGSGGNLIGPVCPAEAPNCGAKLYHGSHSLLDDPLGFGTGDAAGSNFGAPAFSGWPRASTTTHQQVYYRWLERAWRGGLRFISMLAVTNEALCEGGKRERNVNCDDSQGAIDAQIQATWDFQDWLDDQSGGPGQGWFRIVTSPQQARQVIGDGKLAVMLGIEVDNLFNCKQGLCDEAYVRAQVDRIYDLGVRHVFPIHNFDNAFGATAVWNNIVHVGNRVSEGAWFTTEECAPEGFSFKISTAVAFFISLFGFGNLDSPDPADYPETASCNRGTLTPLGEFLVGYLMDKGMLIDIDHMGRHAIDRTLQLAEARSYPVIASHAAYYDLHLPSARNERLRTRAQLDRIRALGGIVAPIGGPTDTDDDGAGAVSSYGPVTLDCLGSSQHMAQKIDYTADVMGGPVPIGTDLNGVAGHLSPRFGNLGCGSRSGQRAIQERFGQRLGYPFALDDFGTLDRLVTGHKTFDYNVDGFAHIGLLPDMLKDLEVVGLGGAEREAVWRSAQGIVEVWERARGEFSPPPVASCRKVTTSAGPSCAVAADISANGARSDARVQVSQSPPGPYGPGQRSVTLRVEDVCGGAGPTSCVATVEVIDDTAPTLSCPADRTLECDGALTTVHYPSPVIQDNCSAALTGCSKPSGGDFVLGSTAINCSGVDTGGNAAACGFSVRVEDTLRPRIEAPPDWLDAECNSPLGSLLDLGDAVASDRCDPSLLVTHDAPPRLPLGHTLVTWTALDDSGHAASDAQQIAVIDTTPPNITCPADQIVECTTGDGVADVTLAAAATSDACSAPSVSTAAPPAFALGRSEVTYTATDGVGLQRSCLAAVNVVDTSPPNITCPQRRSVECSGGESAFYAPVAPGISDACFPANTLDIDMPPSGDYGVGLHLLDYRVTDGAGLSASCQGELAVVDTTPPAPALTPSLEVLWPPSREMVTVDINVGGADLCDGAVPSCVLVGISSDERNIGEENDSKAPDFRIAGPTRAELRATRNPKGDGRIYTLELSCSDTRGNAASFTTQVQVPLDCYAGADSDGDGWNDCDDTCPAVVNPAQLSWSQRAFVPNAKVAHRDQLYICRPWPRTPWCGQAGYEPGVAAPFKEAWFIGPSCKPFVEPEVACNGDSWVRGRSYRPGERVIHDGMEYECRMGQRSRWCGQRGYEPGRTLYWAQAWMVVNNCK